MRATPGQLGDRRIRRADSEHGQALLVLLWRTIGKVSHVGSEALHNVMATAALSFGASLAWQGRHGVAFARLDALIGIPVSLLRALHERDQAIIRPAFAAGIDAALQPRKDPNPIDARARLRRL